MLGVEQLTVDGAVIRTIAKTTADGQFPVQRELRRRLTEALEISGHLRADRRVADVPAARGHRLRVARARLDHARTPIPAGQPDLRERRIGGCRSYTEQRMATPYALATARSIGQNPGEAPQLQCHVPLLGSTRGRARPGLRSRGGPSADDGGPVSDDPPAARPADGQDTPAGAMDDRPATFRDVFAVRRVSRHLPRLRPELGR